MISLDLIQHNLLSPPILFFVLGLLAGLMKSDLSVPESISHYFSLYLMMAIGFKGGTALAAAPEFHWNMIALGMTGAALSAAFPVLAYNILRRTAGLDRVTAAAMATSYGSISIVTFATAMAFLNAQNLPFHGTIVAIAALKEAPAIVTGLWLIQRGMRKDGIAQKRRVVMHAMVTNGSILLLLGSLLIGWITGSEGSAMVNDFLITPFQGVLCIFLLDMGLMVSRQAQALRTFKWQAIAFALYFPFIGAVVGALLARLLGIDLGTSFLFAVLCASASYIAAPAALRLAVPEVSPAVYLPMTLALTFPMNIVVGLPVYFEMAKGL